MHLDLGQIILTIGYAGVIGVIFAESGLLFGFFFPGDSLLITAGLLASQGYLSLPLLMLSLTLASIAGVAIGYWFGNKIGARLFEKRDTFIFKKKYLLEAQRFYEIHGGKTIILARFVPIVRTFAPIVAGVVGMDYKKFMVFNVVGGVLWINGILVLGYFLGNTIPDVDKYLLPIIGLVVILSLVPGVYHQRATIFSKLRGMNGKE